MVMPLAGRVVAAVIGGLLVIIAGSSVIGTLVVTRPVSSRLTRWVDRAVNRAYQLVVSRAADFRRRDQLLATEDHLEQVTTGSAPTTSVNARTVRSAGPG